MVAQNGPVIGSTLPLENGAMPRCDAAEPFLSIALLPLRFTQSIPSWDLERSLMPDRMPRYETRTIHTVRGLEARTQSKMEQDGWELLERADAPMLRSKLTFRRERKPLPRWAWIGGGAAAAAIVIAIVVGSIYEGEKAPTPATTTAAAAASPLATSTPTAPPSASRSAFAAAPEAVAEAEVLAAFNTYFQERAAAGAVLGKAVTNVNYTGRIVTVTFSPAAAGVSQEVFDYGNPFPNLAKFAATPIAFNDELGNRIRPVVDTIRTVRDDGLPLGTYTHAEILALNELSE